MRSSKIRTGRLRPGLMVLLAAAMAALLPISMSGAASGGEPSVRVIDGDSVQIGAEVFDLYGIDAPELGQICLNGGVPWHCGLDAAYALVKRFVFDPPHCRPIDLPADDQSLPHQIVCTSGGKPAAAVLLADGYAAALEPSGSDYQRVQNRAKRATLGIWRGRYVAPAKWREGIRLPQESGHAPACPVKAVTTAQGNRVYYVPFDPQFAALKFKPSEGGRCFGSDEAARRAGYGRPETKP